MKSTEPRVGPEARPERAAREGTAPGRLCLSVAGGGVGVGGSDARVLREDGEGQHNLALRHGSAGKKSYFASHFIGELPDLISASDRGRAVMRKRMLQGRLRKFLNINQNQMRKRGGGQKIRKFC